MKAIKLSAFSILLTSIVLCSACKKDWLDAKPNKALVVPSTVTDYQAFLDNSSLMIRAFPSLSMVGDGDFYVTDTYYNSIGSPYEKGAYSWAATADFYGAQRSSDWPNAYNRILQDNIVLDGLPSIKVDDANQAVYNNVKGTALFYRSLDFYNLAQQYCKVYDVNTANTDLGLPLRTSSNINLTVNRATVQQTYDQVINDLQQAAPLLPVTPLFATRPSKPAVYGLLARVYLSQDNYSKAFLYADSCLQLQSTLIDFNQLSLTASAPIAALNKEEILHATLAGIASTNPPNLIVDPNLYQSFTANDLRKSIFFVNTSGIITIKGSLSGSSFSLFGGIGTDEVYLIRAECYARAGNTISALNDLNILLKTRWITGTYINMAAANADAALAIILTERRKELCFRNLRWTDLRRLNKDPRFQVTLTRAINGQTYTLAPKSSRYVLPLDPFETTSGGLQQNPRD